MPGFRKVTGFRKSLKFPKTYILCFFLFRLLVPVDAVDSIFKIFYRKEGFENSLCVLKKEKGEYDGSRSFGKHQTRQNSQKPGDLLFSEFTAIHETCNYFLKYMEQFLVLCTNTLPLPRPPTCSSSCGVSQNSHCQTFVPYPPLECLHNAHSRQ